MDSAEALHRAARLGDLSLLSKALSQAPACVNLQDCKLGWTALYRAVICGHPAAAQMLLKQGADPNLASKSGDTPLHLAADDGNYRLVAALLTAGADPNFQQNDGETALHKAAAKGKHRVCWLLLRQGADPNRPNSAAYRTPLHLAVAMGRVKVVDTMLGFEANPCLKDKSGNTAFDLAASEEMRSTLRKRQKSPTRSISGDRESLESDISGTLSTPPPLLSEASVEPGNHKESLSSLMEAIANFPLMSQENLATVEECDSYLNYTSDFSPQSSAFCPKSGSFGFEPESEHVEEFVGTLLHRSFSFGADSKVSSLYSWLAQVRLEGLFDKLVEAGYDDLEALKRQVRSGKPLGVEELKKIGVRKAGHRLRFLACLEEEAKGRPRLQSHTASAAPVSLHCCVQTAAVSAPAPLPTLQQWLDSLNLAHLMNSFVDSGFDDLEQLLGLMHTRYIVTDQVLKEDVGVGKLGYRQRLLIRIEEDCGLVEGMIRQREEDFGAAEKAADATACSYCILM